MEAVVVVALLGIVGALVVGQVIGLMKAAYHREVEEIAKELYVAAEHHLSVASSNHKLESIPEAKRGTPDLRAKEVEGLEGVYYYVVGSGTADYAYLSDAQSVLYAMLPPMSIDETIRAGGSYVLRYQYLDGDATLLDVFYASPEGRNGRWGYSFTAEPNGGAEPIGDYAKLVYSPSYIGAAKYDSRANYENTDSCIGWYDGGDGNNSTARLRPRISVENAERLTVSIDNWRSFLGPTGALPSDYSIYLDITGVSSEAEAHILTKGGDGPHDGLGFDLLVRAHRTGANYTTYSFDIDSIVKEEGDASNSHFLNLKNRLNDGSITGQFIPGEDLKIQVRLVRKDPNATNGEIPTESAVVTRNSLFASLEETAEGSKHYIAKIANARHLENISNSISGLAALSVGTNAEFGIESFKQTKDISWTEFRKRVVGLRTDSEDNAKSRAIEVTGSSGTAYAAGEAGARSYEPGSFIPIDPSKAIVYDGGSNHITDVIVASNKGENTGVFGTLQSGSEVSHLELVDFDIATSAGNAGALVGTAQGVTIKNVLVRNTPAADAAGANATDAQKTAAAEAEAKLEIRGSATVGGLVGTASDNTVIENCAAAVYVKSTADAAGGLVGSISGGSITNSYAGGHTSGGMYVDSTGEATIGRYNVQAGGAAGGLVGTTNGTSITASYATASANGGKAGGLVGSLSGGIVDKCYAAGLVKGATDADMGTFAGSLSSTDIKATNYVLDIVNNPTGDSSSIHCVGSSSDYDKTIIAIDKDVETYNAFVQANATAQPYDAALPSVFTLTTVTGLSDTDTVPWFIGTHVGDWPTPETLVVNVRQS